MRHHAKYVSLAVLAAAVSFGLPSPAHAASEDRALPPFVRIVTDGAFTLMVEAGEAQSVHLQSNPDFLARIKTSVADSVLLIETIGQGTIRADIRISITMPVFEGLTILGATDAEITNVETGPVSLAIDGAGDVPISVEIRGAGVAG